MSILAENKAKFEKLGEFCKKFWNIRVEPDQFREKMKKEFPQKDIELFIIFFIEKMGQNPRALNNSIKDYMFSIICEDLSVVFADLDLENHNLVIGARKIVEMSKVDSFNALPVYSERSAKSALNALIVVLMNENKSEMKKDVLQLACSTYFSILISSGRLFHPEKYKVAQDLFKENDPFDSPIYQLPVTQMHLAMSLFQSYSMEQITDNDNYKNLFMLFAVFQLINNENFNIKIINNNSDRASIQSSFINYYLSRPSYVLSLLLSSFSKKQLKFGNIIKMRNVYSPDEGEIDQPCSFHFYSNFTNNINRNEKKVPLFESGDFKEDENNILHNLYDSNKNSYKPSAVFNFNIIHEQLPNGIFPTYESAIEFLSALPESISIETLIEDGLHYPAFATEIANIFMSKLKEKDFESAVILSLQVLKRIDDIRITWIAQKVFFPIMTELYECLNELDNEKHFEVLFYLFISFYEGCTKLGDESIVNAIRKFISKINEPFRLFLENSLNKNSEVIICQKEYISDERPISRLINSLKKYNEIKDIDVDELIHFPYLFLSAFLWGVKTVHPNSLKLLSVKFPNYKILKRYFVYLSACHQDKNKNCSSNIFFTIPINDCSIELLTRFPPSSESELRLIILQNISCMSTYNLSIKEVQGLLISWRSWIKIFSIEKFVLILIETIVWNGENKIDQMKARNNFIFASRLLTTTFVNPIKTSICASIDNQMEFDENENKFIPKNINKLDYNFDADDIFKAALWTALEFLKNYQGSFSDGMGIASFCLLLIISLKNNWKSEFSKVLDFIMKLMEDSNWKSLKHSFIRNFLYISLSILEVQELINIEKFDIEFLQVNWRFSINCFFLQSEIKRLQEMKLISLE